MSLSAGTHGKVKWQQAKLLTIDIPPPLAKVLDAIESYVYLKNDIL